MIDSLSLNDKSNCKSEEDMVKKGVSNDGADDDDGSDYGLENKTFLTTIKKLNNYSLPVIDTNQSLTINNRNNKNSKRLVPFFIHAPDRSDTFTALRTIQTPKAPSFFKPRRTSSSSSSSSSNSKKLALRPLSSYLTRKNSNDNLVNNGSDYFLDPNQGLSPSNGGEETKKAYGDEDRRRDFSQPIGFIDLDRLLRPILRDNQKMIDMNCKPCWKVLYKTNGRNGGLKDNNSSVVIEDDFDQETLNNINQVWGLSFEDWINESTDDPVSLRTEHFDRLARVWKESGLFPEILNGWRDEDYSIYGPKGDDDQRFKSYLPGSNVGFKIERAASALFGFLTFGAHLTAYVKKDGEYFIWTPRRSAKKPTYPSKLDNTAAGGIQSNESPLESIIRESLEEASLDEDYVRKNIKSIGLISYVHQNKFGWVQPELQYTFELELPSDNSMVPIPNDGESEDFKLLYHRDKIINFKTDEKE